MNKYEKALVEFKTLLSLTKGMLNSEIDTYDSVVALKELIDKATPTRVLRDDRCSHCDTCISTEYGEPKHCHNCGQILKWREEKEEKKSL